MPGFVLGLVLGGALGGDQLVEPPHFPLARVEAELVELMGVVVDLLPCPGEGCAQPFAALLDRPPAAFEDPHPRVGRGAGEEREVDAEAFVVPRLRSGLGQQLGEPLLAVCGDPVDPPAPPRPAAWLLRGLLRILDDQSGAREAAQRRVQRPVGEQPEAAQPQAELLAQLVAVYGGLLEQPEDRQLEHVDIPFRLPRSDSASR